MWRGGGNPPENNMNSPNNSQKGAGRIKTVRWKGKKWCNPPSTCHHPPPLPPGPAGKLNERVRNDKHQQWEEEMVMHTSCGRFERRLLSEKCKRGEGKSEKMMGLLGWGEEVYFLFFDQEGGLFSWVEERRIGFEDEGGRKEKEKGGNIHFQVRYSFPI